VNVTIPSALGVSKAPVRPSRTDSERESLVMSSTQETAAEIDASSFPVMRQHVRADAISTTQFVDVGIVLKAEIALIRDDGTETTPREGDAFLR
jgi:hypothetical protein